MAQYNILKKELHYKYINVQGCNSLWYLQLERNHIEMI